MGKILCATRGGEASYRTQDAAIALAKERGDTLLFLYVVDLHFLDKTAAPIVVDVGNEVTKMGAALVVLGRPAGAMSVFELVDLEAFAAQIEAETGVETRII